MLLLERVKTSATRSASLDAANNEAITVDDTDDENNEKKYNDESDDERSKILPSTQPSKYDYDASPVIAARSTS